MRLARRAAAAVLARRQRLRQHQPDEARLLTGLDALKIASSAAIDGEVLPRGYMPASLDELARVDVRYVELPGWTDLSLCRASARTCPRTRGCYVRAVDGALGGRHLVGRRRPDAATTRSSCPASISPPQETPATSRDFTMQRHDDVRVARLSDEGARDVPLLRLVRGPRSRRRRRAPRELWSLTTLRGARGPSRSSSSSST